MAKQAARLHQCTWLGIPANMGHEAAAREHHGDDRLTETCGRGRCATMLQRSANGREKFMVLLNDLIDLAALEALQSPSSKSLCPARCSCQLGTADRRLGTKTFCRCVPAPRPARTVASG